MRDVGTIAGVSDDQDEDDGKDEDGEDDSEDEDGEDEDGEDDGKDDGKDDGEDGEDEDQGEDSEDEDQGAGEVDGNPPTVPPHPASEPTPNPHVTTRREPCLCHLTHPCQHCR